MASDNLSDFFEPEGERGAFDDPDQEWYFDLPSGAWERQEQKNRELRQAVKRNTNPNEPQAVARVAPVKRRAEGPWQSSGGTWQLDKGGGSSALESAPLRASRPEPASRWSSDGDGGYDEEDGPPIVDRIRAWPRSSADEPSNSSGEAPGIPFLRRENTPSGRPPQPVATAGLAIGENEHEPEQEQERSLWGGPEAAAKRRVLKAATFGESAAGAPEYAPPPPAEEEIGKRNLWMAGDDPLPVQTPAKRRNLWKAELEAARAQQAAAAETETRTESERSEERRVGKECA